MALRLRNPESGLGLTGNTSNKDLQFLKDSVVGLARTEQGNKLIIKFMMRQNDMKKAVARKQTQIRQANDGKTPDDIDSQIMDFIDNYEFFSKGEREQINRSIEKLDAKSC